MTSRRTPLVAGGFIAGALIGALPPVQTLSASWQCASSGGRYEVALRTCEYRVEREASPPVHPASPRLLEEEDR